MLQRHLAVLAVLSGVAGCGAGADGDAAAADTPRGAAGGRIGPDGPGATVAPPLLALPPEVPQPASNPTSAAKVALGRALFWDPVLSGDRDVACATCHHPAFAYTDGIALSIGVGGTHLGPARVPDAAAPHRTPRNAMTVLDAAYNGLAGPVAAVDASAAPMFWDSRARALEGQARGPITTLAEMRGTSFSEATIFPELIARLGAIPEYVSAFEAAYGQAPITEAAITGAIAAFERTLVDHDSSYDRFAKGDTSALSASARRGLQVFARSGCSRCHSGPMFSDFKLHRLGVRDLPGAAHDVGDGAGRFRTGSLRNVARTAPYMHNGSLASLDDVFRFYERVDRRLDPDLQGLRAPEGQDAADVKAFLSALSDGDFDRSVPDSVPSGLSVGGNVR